MKKIVKLTETQLEDTIKRIINEFHSDPEYDKRDIAMSLKRSKEQDVLFKKSEDNLKKRESTFKERRQKVLDGELSLYEVKFEHTYAGDSDDDVTIIRIYITINPTENINVKLNNKMRSFKKDGGSVKIISVGQIDDYPMGGMF